VKAEITILAMAMALAACSEQVERPAAAAQPPAPPPAPNATAPSYEGRWAVSLAACQDGGWEFAKNRVGTAGEVSCEFERVTPNATGYAIEAQCTAQAPPELKSFTLTLAGVGPAETMTVAGGPWSAPVALVRCPPG
jgi:hypothetical protein